jgi:two-component system, LytTR family, sensor kinase
MWVSAALLWPAVLNVLNRILQVELQGWDAPTQRDLLFAAGDWLLYALFAPIIFWISTRWPIVRQHLPSRALIHASWAITFCVAWALLGKLLELGLMATFAPHDLQEGMARAGGRLGQAIAMNVAGWILTTLPFGVIVYMSIAGAAHAISYFSDARDREMQLVRLSAQLTDARYTALQAQLNPHFLFNTLNTIAVLIRDGDRTAATGIVERLSVVLRRTLSRHGANEVALDDELELVQEYLAIEAARFPDRLRVRIETHAVPGHAAVPGFALQHLVENALRHGIARHTDAGQLQIDVRRRDAILEITVQDDGPGLTGDEAMAGHGLENTRERLRALYGSNGTLVLANAPSRGAIATLRLPYRELHVEANDAGA